MIRRNRLTSISIWTFILFLLVWYDKGIKMAFHYTLFAQASFEIFYSVIYLYIGFKERLIEKRDYIRELGMILVWIVLMILFLPNEYIFLSAMLVIPIWIILLLTDVIKRKY
jgi:hypothetical protein